MPGIFPTRLDQVRDNSDRASARYLELMGQPQNSSANILAAIVDRATKANESQLLGDALAAYQRGIESGQKAADILKTLDPRISGSKEFQYRAGDIRDDHIKQTAEDRAQAQWANTLSRQALQDEANLLRAQAIKDYIATSGLGGGRFLKNNEARFNSNPLAANQVMDFYRSVNADLSFDPTATPDSADKVAETFNNLFTNLSTAENINRNFKDSGSYLGIDVSPEAIEALSHKNLNDIITEGAKNRDLTGNEFSDFSENIRKGYAEFKQAVPGLPEWAYLAAVQQNIKPGTFSWLPFVGSWDQDDVDTAPGIKWLSTYKNVLPQVRDNLAIAQSTENLLKKAREDNLIANTQSNLNAQIRKLRSLISQGYSEADINAMIAKATQNAYRNLAGISGAINQINNRAEVIKKLLNTNKENNN